MPEMTFMESITRSILTGMGAVMTPEKFIICAIVALVCGVIISLTHSYKNNANLSLHGTIAFLPIVIMAVIMVVSQNIGAGLAIAGAFTLIRFRSVPGDARSIGNLFCTVAAGTLCGLGYLFYAGLFTIIVCLCEYGIFFALGNVFTRAKRYLRVTIPENLDYDDVFDELFEEFLKHYELIRVKTVNMGSLFELTYVVTSKTEKIPKAFIDKIRERNGNLGIMLSREVPDMTL
jgi:hypothetical protein